MQVTLVNVSEFTALIPPPGGRGVTLVKFCWVCAAGLSEPLYPIIVYSVAKYRPHLSHFWVNM